MYINSEAPKCKVEIGFSTLRELREFKRIIEFANSFSTTDYAFLLNNLQWAINDLKKLSLDLPDQDDEFIEDGEFPFT